MSHEDRQSSAGKQRADDEFRKTQAEQDNGNKKEQEPRMNEAEDAETETPLVSICCITYNHEPFIRDALEGFLKQKVSFPYEILIHDDASADRTPDIIREYAAKYPDKIKPILQKENQYSKGITNPSGAFNFPRAKGKYIAMCEGDDYWTDPDKLRLQVEYLEEHPECCLCIHSARILTIDGSRSDRRMRPYRKNQIITPEKIVDKELGYAMASMVFPARLVKEIPDYYTNCPVGDIPLQLMAAAEGNGYYIDRDMSVYRLGVSVSWTSQGKTGDYEQKQRRYYEQMRETYREFDKATEGRFHKEAVSAARRIWYLTRVNTRQYEDVLDKKYRRYFRELTLRTRFYIGMEVYAPGLYKVLLAIAAWEKKRLENRTSSPKEQKDNT